MQYNTSTKKRIHLPGKKIIAGEEQDVNEIHVCICQNGKHKSGREKNYQAKERKIEKTPKKVIMEERCKFRVREKKRRDNGENNLKH